MLLTTGPASDRVIAWGFIRSVSGRGRQLFLPRVGAQLATSVAPQLERNSTKTAAYLSKLLNSFPVYLSFGPLPSTFTVSLGKSSRLPYHLAVLQS